jgi:DNA polymerase III gamma/tau subunit
VKHIQKKIKSTEYSFAYELDKNQILQLLNIFIAADKSLKNAVIPVLVLEMIIPQVDFKNLAKSSISSPDLPTKPSKTTTSKSSETSNTDSDSLETEKDLDPGKDAVTINVTAHVTAPRESETSQKTEKHPEITLSLKDIEVKWDEVTKVIREANGHLFAFLQAAHLKSFEEGVLILQVAFEFHKDRVESIKSREAILEVFQKVYGVKFLYKCEVNDQIKVRKQVGPEIILSQNAIEVNQQSGSPAATESKNVPTNNSTAAQSATSPTAPGKEEVNVEKKKFAFKRGLGKEVDEMFAGL